MLAIDNNNQVVLVKEPKPTATLVLVDNNPLPQGFLDLKAMLSTKRFETHHIYDNVLSGQERAALCFAAGLGRGDLNKAFKDFSDNQKLALHKAVLMMQRVYKAFSDAKAISSGKFLQMPEHATNIKGIR